MGGGVAVEEKWKEASFFAFELEKGSRVSYKPFLILFGGATVSVLTGRNHKSTVMSGQLGVFETHTH